jgi:hypothetical protein
MGAFNEWVKGSFLENWENRRVVTVAMNILYWTAVLVRVNSLRSQGIWAPGDKLSLTPLELAELERRL